MPLRSQLRIRAMRLANSKRHYYHCCCCFRGCRSPLLLAAFLLLAVAVLTWLARSSTRTVWIPSPPPLYRADTTSDLSVRREAVKEMARFAWRRYADACGYTGENELAPVTNSCAPQPDELVGARQLLTAVDSLDTLALMQLQEEFTEASALVAHMLRPRTATNQLVSVFETTIRSLGGLLGAYSLTGDAKFVDMAEEVADGLAGAFADADRMTPKLVRMFANDQQDGGASSLVAAAREYSETLLLADVGTLHLELTYLSHISGNGKYAKWARNNQDRLMRLKSSCGLYPSQFGPRGQARSPSGRLFSAGGGSDSFYEYLFKRCLYDKLPDPECRRTYTKSLDGIMDYLTVTIPSEFGSLACVTGSDRSCGEHKLTLADCSMEHLTCFLGGTYALAYLENPHRTDWLQFAENVTRTCYLSYAMSPTGLGTEMFSFTSNGTLLLRYGFDFYILRPEVVESIYYLWYVTGRQEYQDWGWRIVQAINASARSQQGFSGVTNMLAAGKYKKPQLDNRQQSFFLAETLKYLYLLFSPKDTLRLDQWLLTTEAHIIPTRKNPIRRRMHG